MEWQKVRKKPIEVEAFQLTEDMIPQRKTKDDGKGKTKTTIGVFLDKDKKIFASNDEGGFFIVTTLEGDVRTEVGNYIIKGIKGEVYPCRKDIFEATYDILGKVKEE